MRNLVKKALAVATLAAAVASVAHAGDSKWYDNMKMKGDIRYRFQQDDSGAATNADRSRNRMRVRLGTYGKVNDTMDFGIRLATGGDGSIDSANQSLSGGFGKYAISLDQAYIDMKVMDGAKLTFGKMSNPFWAPQGSQLVWDGDINPEGIAFSYASGSFFATAGYLVPDSDSAGGSQELSGLQLGFKAAGFTVGAAYYTSSHDPAAAASADLTNGAEMFNIGADYSFKMGSLKSAVYVDYLSNSDDSGASDQSNSYQVGFKVKGEGWKAEIAYLDEGDEGFSGMGDSDFNGTNADSEGYKIAFGYDLAKHASAGITYFAWETSQSTPAASLDKSTLQLDLAVKF